MSEKFTVLLADIPIEANVLYPSTRRFCGDYLTDTAPEVSVFVSTEDIEYERQKSFNEDKRLGNQIRNFKPEYLETLALYRKIIYALLPKNVLLYHGALIAYKESSVLFTAPSGTGKTTHIRLWHEAFGDDCYVINGDKPLIKFTDNGIIAYGTPWQGKENYGCNKCLPLKAICSLHRDTENSISRISPIKALPTLMQQTYHFTEKDDVALMMKMISRLAGIDLYSLGCNMDIEAALVAKRGIFDEHI